MTTIYTEPVRRRKTTVVTRDEGVADEAVVTRTPGEVTQKTAIFRAYQVIWYILGFIEVFLAFRLFFKLLGANVGSPFVQLIYGVTDGMVYPFGGIFPVLGIGRSYLDWAALLAMAVYALLAYALVYLFQLIKPVDVEEVEQGVDNPP